MATYSGVGHIQADASDTKKSILNVCDGMKVYLYVLAVTACMIVIIFTARAIYPFGDGSLRYLDDGAQNFGLLGYLQRTIYGNDNLLYSWSTVLGGNMSTMFAYGAASPFNLLVVFFPGNLMAAYHFIFAVKLMAAALCFAAMLTKVFPGTDSRIIVLFSSSYPFIGYITYYAWNQSWMDGAVFLPLVFLGIWQLVKHGKWLLYTVSLAVAVLSNFYIGYMVCLASVVLFIGVLVAAQEKSGWRPVVRKIIFFLGSSLLALGLTAVLLLPALNGIPEGIIKPGTELFDEIEYTSRPEEILSMLFTAPYGNMQYSNNYPVIYTGIVQLLLVVAFFLNEDVPGRYKAVCAVLLTLLAVAFSVSSLNVAWHGFSENVWFNFRYSFIVSFVIELTAFYSFLKISQVRSRLILAGVLMAVILMLALRAEKANIGAGTLVFDVLWICAALLALYAYAGSAEERSGKKQWMLFLIVAGLTLGNLLENAYLSLDKLESCSEYGAAQSIDAQIVSAVDDDGFFRLGSTWRYGAADPLRAGYAGVENFNTYENYEAVDAASRLGVSKLLNGRTQYDVNVPMAADAILCMQYIVTDSDTYKKKYYTERGVVADTGLAVYENGYAIPIVFPADSVFDSDGEDLNRFEYLNSYWNSISSVGGNVFSNVTYDRNDTPTSSGSDVTFKFTAQSSGPVYAAIPRGDYTSNAPMPSRYQSILYLGDFEKGEDGELIVHAGEKYKGTDSIVLYSEHPEALAAKAGEIGKDSIVIDEISSSHLAIDYSAETNTIFASTIPFDKGWHVYIDEDETETYVNMDSFLAFDVPAGDHRIELVYWPPGFWLGVVISSCSLAIVLFAAIRQYIKRKSGVSGDGTVSEEISFRTAEPA